MYGDDDSWRSALSSGALPNSEAWDTGGGFAGDFYNVPDNVVRGIAVGAADVPHMGGGLGDDFGKDFSKGGFFDFAPPEMEFASLSRTHADDYARVSQQFSEEDPTPVMPADPLFKLEATTFFAAGCSSAAAIGNALLEFLGTKVVASVTKVNRRKCCVKADVFVDGSMCTMKVRVYSQPGGRFAIEFQRRCGNAIVFNVVYQQAVEFMRPVCAGLPEPNRDGTGPVEVSPPVPPQILGVSEVNADVSPLLDMAGMVEVPQLQAEAAAALATIARDSEPTPLCNERAFSEFKTLVQADSIDVAYPSSQLLKHLAQRPEAGRFFAQSGIVLAILAKILQPTVTCALVQQELAQALSASMIICASELPAPAAEDLAGKLSQALAAENQFPGRVLQSLRAASEDLDSRRAR